MMEATINKTLGVTEVLEVGKDGETYSYWVRRPGGGEPVSPEVAKKVALQLVFSEKRTGRFVVDGTLYYANVAIEE